MVLKTPLLLWLNFTWTCVTHIAQMTVRTQTLGKLCCICDSACQTLYVGWLPCLADFPVWPPAHKGHSSALLLILRGRLLLVRRNLFPALSVSCTELEDAHNFLCSLKHIPVALSECFSTCFECVDWLCNIRLFPFSYYLLHKYMMQEKKLV